MPKTENARVLPKEIMLELFKNNPSQFQIGQSVTIDPALRPHGPWNFDRLNGTVKEIWVEILYNVENDDGDCELYSAAKLKGV
jgi:hypothetical protein